MARVHHVKKARKDYPKERIKKGDSYYWWKFNFSRYVHRSLTPPRRSQLTQSDFLSQVYDIEDRLEGLSSCGDIDEVKAEVEEIIEEIRTLGEEQSEKQYNMPDSLQYSPTGELLENRAQECEEWASSIESVDIDVGDAENEEEKEEKLQDIVEELQGYGYTGE